MNIANGIYDLPPDKIVTVVTALEMLAMPSIDFQAPHPGGELRFVSSPDPAFYRSIYKKVGQEWLWFSRLVMPDHELTNITDDPKVEIRILEIDGEAEALLELDYRIDGECELAFLGVSENLIGAGAGKWLMQQAIDLAWSNSIYGPIQRLWVHTCTLDHPRALSFYIRSGFTPYKRQLEIADDPRLTGEASLDSAGHFPLLKQMEQS